MKNFILTSSQILFNVVGYFTIDSDLISPGYLPWPEVLKGLSLPGGPLVAC